MTTAMALFIRFSRLPIHGRYCRSREGNKMGRKTWTAGLVLFAGLPGGTRQRPRHQAGPWSAC